jgi:tetratricopeptide (TPR) repeat protein
MPEWGRPVTPAEGRALHEEIGRLSSRLNVSVNTLTAIARILGAGLRTISFQELIQRIQAQAERVAELQVQLSNLRRQIAALTNAAVRSPAQQALARATLAFDEGRLEDAEREFATLESLRNSETREARIAWVDAVRAQAHIAVLRLDYDRADELLLAADREEQRLSSQVRWQFQLDRADARYQQGSVRGDSSALERAIAIYRDEALPLAPRAERPEDWAMSQNALGIALMTLGMRQEGAEALDAAVAAFRAALEIRTRDALPLEWALTQNNLGITLMRLGERQDGTLSLSAAVTAYRAALEVTARDTQPLEWAAMQNNLGNVMERLDERQQGTGAIEAAVAAYRAALEVRSREAFPRDWAMVQNNLSNALRRLATEQEGTKAQARALNAAVSAANAALEIYTVGESPLEWAAAQNNLGTALLALGAREQGTRSLDAALAALRAALQVYTREALPLDWATTQNNIGYALWAEAERLGHCTTVREAVTAFEAALEILARPNVPAYGAAPRRGLSETQALRDRLCVG